MSKKDFIPSPFHPDSSVDDKGVADKVAEEYKEAQVIRTAAIEELRKLGLSDATINLLLPG
jgi:hypothetical protein